MEGKPSKEGFGTLKAGFGLAFGFRLLECLIDGTG